MGCLGRLASHSLTLNTLTLRKSRAEEPSAPLQVRPGPLPRRRCGRRRGSGRARTSRARPAPTYGAGRWPNTLFFNRTFSKVKHLLIATSSRLKHVISVKKRFKFLYEQREEAKFGQSPNFSSSSSFHLRGGAG